MCHYAGGFPECHAEKDSEIGAELSEGKTSGVIGTNCHHY